MDDEGDRYGFQHREGNSHDGTGDYMCSHCHDYGCDFCSPPACPWCPVCEVGRDPDERICPDCGAILEG